MTKVLLSVLSVALFAFGVVFSLGDGSKPSVLGYMTSSSGSTLTTEPTNTTMSDSTVAVFDSGTTTVSSSEPKTTNTTLGNTSTPKTTISVTTSESTSTMPSISSTTDDTMSGATSATSSLNTTSSLQISSKTDTTSASGYMSSATSTRIASEDTVTPSVPTGVSVEFIGPMTARVRWQPSTDNVGVANYLVFRNGEHVGTVYDTRYDDVSVQPGKQYAYTVVATDVAKNQSRKSGLQEIIVPDEKDDVSIVQSTVSTPVVLTVNRVPDPVKQAVDSDHDGLSNDEEARLGTDPNNPDTDGDGYKDGDEISAGFDPLKFSLGDKRDKIVFQLPKSESSTEQLSLLDARYAVTDIKIVKASDTGKDVTRFFGKGLPNSYVTLYIYSEPIIVVVKTDENGNWQYDLDKNIENGDHEVYVAVTDTLGRITAQSSPIPFVKTAEAITVKSATPLAQAVKANQSPIDRSVWQYIGVGVVFATVFIAIAIVVIRRRQQSVVNE